jgi:hypothetical protein
MACINIRSLLLVHLALCLFSKLELENSIEQLLTASKSRYSKVLIKVNMRHGSK